MNTRTFATAVALAAFGVAGSAGAQELSFVDFDETTTVNGIPLAVGDSLEGVMLDQAPDLVIHALNQGQGRGAVVIGTGEYDPEILQTNPAMAMAYSAPNDVNPLLPNNCLEYGDILSGGWRVEMTTGTSPAAPAQGFADVDTAVAWGPQEFEFTFNERTVSWFELRMLDFGDYNPKYPSATQHLVRLEAWNDTTEPPALVDSQSLEFTNAGTAIPVLTNVTGDACWPGTDLGSEVGIDDAAALAEEPLYAHPGYVTLSVSNLDGPITRVKLVVPPQLDDESVNGYDPKVGFDSIYFVTDAGQQTPEMEIDIHTLSCPNPINLRSTGVIPVAILGTATFRVRGNGDPSRDVNPTTVRLEGCAPVMAAVYGDVSRPYDGDFYLEDGTLDRNACLALTSLTGPDGYEDLSLKFSTSCLSSLPAGVQLLNVTASLYDGTELSAQDVVVIRK